MNERTDNLRIVRQRRLGVADVEGEAEEEVEAEAEAE